VLGDRRLEANESFRLVLSDPLNGMIGRGTASATIRNDDTAADWNGDGKADLLWREMESGHTVLMFMQTTTATHWAGLNVLVPVNWRMAGFADFDDNGQADILWQDEESGTLAVAFMSGAEMTSVLFPAAMPEWRVVAAADFNDDGRPDILWRHAAAGSLAVWFMNGVTPTGWAFVDPGPLAPDARITAVADFDDDGKPDLLWHDEASGLIAVSPMDGVSARGEASISLGHAPGMTVGAVADYSGDGQPDIVLRNEWGFLHVVVVRDLAGLVPSPSGVPTNWKLAGPR
jgi:hypothetical protein